MDLHQDRPPISLEAFDDPAFPGRQAGVQGSFQGVGDGTEEFGVAAGLRQGNALHVWTDVHARLNPVAQQIPDQVVVRLVPADDGNCRRRCACISVVVRRST